MARITNALRHVHQYFRMPTTGLWYCSGIDGCTHYMPKNMPEPVGRMSLCWICKKQFMLTPINMLLDKPLCDKCASEQEDIDMWLEEKLKQNQESRRIFGAPETDNGVINRANKMRSMIKKDEVEVIEAEEDFVIHNDDCDVWRGMACSCS